MDDLFRTEQRLSNTEIVHPKAATICDYILSWLPQPSILSLRNKILVIVFRGNPEMYSSLLNQLQLVKGLKTAILHGNSQFLSAIDSAHVVITDLVSITENFPWSRFTSVIAYENKIEWLRSILTGKALKLNHALCLKGVVSLFPHEQDEYKEEGTFLLSN